MKSLGAVKVFTQVNQNDANAKIPVIIPIRVDVVESNVHMLISHESMSIMRGIIDFESRTLQVPEIGKIKLVKNRIRPFDDSRLQTV